MKDSKGADAAKEVLYKKDFWSAENQKYNKPHLRMEKVARTVNKIARNRECTLLDVGCGPATLARLLDRNVRYYGVDIAISKPRPNLLEADLLKNPISFGDMRFDIVVAQGFFEYAGNRQAQKFAEITRLLNRDGSFIVSYVNFDHRRRDVYWPYSNVQPFRRFRTSLEEYYEVNRVFATSYNWNHIETSRKLLRAANMRIDANIPILNRMLAVQYILICSARKSADRHSQA